MATRCIPHIYNPSPMTEDEGCILAVAIRPAVTCIKNKT